MGIFWILAALAALAAVSFLAPLGFGGCMTGSWMMGPWTMGGGWWMALVWIGFWALVIVGAYLLISGYMTPRGRGYDRALEIAKERFARGEITLEEFERIKKKLS